MDEFTEADLPSVLEVERSASAWPWSESDFRGSLASSHLCMGVKTDERLCAHAVFSLAAGEAELLILAVHSDFQRRGLGNKMLSLVMQELAKEVREMFLEVRESNTKAIRFYEALGFNCLGERRHYYPARDHLPRENALIYGIHMCSHLDDNGMITTE